MITGLTGLPRSGKSLMCVYDILRPLVGTKVPHQEHGKIVEYPRVIYSNIDSLLLDHEKIDADGINTWHEWAPPGAVLAIDEVQDFWPPRPNGSKVPAYIEKLATHGHGGVDIVYMTQHPMMVDQNLRNLTGRHLHVRRVASLPAAVVYEWDHCSRQLLYSNALSKSPWRYPKKGYTLYRSASLHTKMKRKLPAILWAFPLLIAAGWYLVPRVYATATGSRPVVTAQSPGQAQKKAPAPIPGASSPVSAPAVVPGLPGLTPVSSMPVVMTGCAQVRDVCRCYDGKGERFEVEASVCVAKVPHAPAFDLGRLASMPPEFGSVAAAGSADLEALAFMRQRRAVGR